VKTADGGAKSIPEGTPELVSYSPGSGYVPVPGDLIIEGATSINGGYGHVAIVDYVEGNIIYAVEQNGSSNGRVNYTYNSSYYSGTEKRGEIVAIVHAPKNTYQNPTPHQDLYLDDIKITNIDMFSYDIEIDTLHIESASKVVIATWNGSQPKEQAVIEERLVDKTNTKMIYQMNTSKNTEITSKQYIEIRIYDAYETMIYVRNLDVILPQVDRIQIINNNQKGYNLIGIIHNKENIEKIEVHTWSTNKGNDDLTIDTISLESNELYYRMNTRDHNNETGKYLSRIYVYDTLGQCKTYDVSATVPELIDIHISNQTSEQYSISATLVKPSKIASIEVETYNVMLGETNSVRRKITPNGETIDVSILTSPFNNQIGEYINTIYITDIHGIETTYILSTIYD
ncbi:MAG: GBS Bsp-like repeat-containing protein, partial [Coprobacillaceae bacterium]